MQSVVRKVKNIHPIFDDIENFYKYTSEKSDKKSLFPLMLDTHFEYLVENFEEYGDFKCDVSFINKRYQRINIPLRKKDDILLAFSGGKDSTANALWYKENGYNVTLYHLRGINQTYKDEWQVCKKIADKLDMPLIIETVSLHGSHCWIEHPMKNMIIANSMIQYCIRNNMYPNIAFGNFTDSSLEDEAFEVCGGDCIEMWESYEDIIAQIIPDFEIDIPFETMRDTWKVILNHKEIIDVVQSCIGPYRYREYLKKKNEKKYDIKLFDHHCGSCWKCALEYCTYADNDLQEYNRGYYSHCLEILKKTYKKECGVKPTIDDIWDYYFSYPRDKSKFFQR